MAETSYLWDNPGTGDSPAPGYGNTLINQVIFRMLTNGTGDQGVLRTWLNELEVTDGGVDTADVDTGGAMLYGVWHESDAVENININAFRGGNCLIIVRASWAAQTARIVARAVGALTQNPGVTYEIPLANVAIDGAGAITLVTDTRDYCEFTTTVPDDSVVSDDIQVDAVTIAKIADVTRRFSQGAGQFEEDVTNPATFIIVAWSEGASDRLAFTTGVTDSIWTTFMVPADISGANITCYVWTSVFAGTGDVRWVYSAWIAAAGGALANSTAAVVVSYSATCPTSGAPHRSQLFSLAVSAGDIVHLEIYRDGGHGADTYASDAYLNLAELEYTADS